MKRLLNLFIVLVDYRGLIKYPIWKVFVPEKDKFGQSVKVLIISFSFSRNDHVLNLKFEFVAFLLFYLNSPLRSCVNIALVLVNLTEENYRKPNKYFTAFFLLLASTN